MGDSPVAQKRTVGRCREDVQVRNDRQETAHPPVGPGHGPGGDNRRPQSNQSMRVKPRHGTAASSVRPALNVRHKKRRGRRLHGATGGKNDPTLRRLVAAGYLSSAGR